MNTSQLILGIESSCDDTGVAIYHATPENTNSAIIADALYSQTTLHHRYGGIVPELASRDHIRKILPLIDTVLRQANVGLGDLTAIAYTQGPGLAGSLLVGATVAKSLGFAHHLPCIPVHHIEAHLLISRHHFADLDFPFLGLLVAGGHTQLVIAKNTFDYEIIGETLDDAAGEAFDKTAKLLGLPANPGGPHLERLAAEGLANRFEFPRPLLKKPGLDFSFSGLKTAVNIAFQNSDQSAQTKADLACAFQTAVVDTLVQKCARALEQTKLTRLVVAGGVGANQALRRRLTEVFGSSIQTFFTPLKHCTDNGAMIAFAGFLRWQRRLIDNDWKIQIKARWPLESLITPINDVQFHRVSD